MAKLQTPAPPAPSPQSPTPQRQERPPQTPQEKTLFLLSRWTNRDLCKAAGPALQDLGYRDPLTLFHGSQDEMGECIRSELKDPCWVPVLNHLNTYSVIREPALFATVLCRLALVKSYVDNPDGT